MFNANVESAEDLRRPLLTTPTATMSRTRQTCLECCCMLCCIVATISTILLVILVVAYLKNSEYPYHQNHNKSILLWQWSNPELGQYVGYEFVDGSKLSPEELRNHTTFEAVIFNASADYKAHPLPMPRLPQQYYIYALDRPLTPAFRQHHNVSELAQFFNLTLSYKLDSDIPWLPYTVSAFDINYTPRLYGHWLPPSENVSDFMKAVYVSKYNSTQLLALTVTEAPCNLASHKYKLLQSIGDLMQVDIYGDCGALSLPQSDKLPSFGKKGAYKFYFAFEEELCTDYVSPYFYEALMNGIVPVVFGGADYTRFAPPNSYIDASDFKTVHGLFDYLQYLQQNMEKYINYFTWRQQYTIYRHHEIFDDLCTFLNYAKERQFAASFADWWQNNKCYEAQPNAFVLNEVRNAN